MADRLGTQVGNYRLTHLLGQGGFAEVYLGVHIHLGTQAAIKLLHAPLASAGEIEKFRQEARTIAALQHPHILRVLDFGVEAGQPYLVLEHAPGGSLRQRYPSGTPVPLATVVSYVQQIAQAVQYAHDQKLIHRDIKPQNLLVGRNGEILLSDFGISVVAESTSRQQAQGFAGTVAYSAPEQLQEHPRPASDQYALGVVVYEWLSGRLPFTGALGEVAAKHLLAAPPSLCAQVPALPPAVEQVVFTALAKDPKDRFATAQAFATALEQASKTDSPHPFVPASTQTVPSPPHISPAIALSSGFPPVSPVPNPLATTQAVLPPGLHSPLPTKELPVTQSPPASAFLSPTGGPTGLTWPPASSSQLSPSTFSGAPLVSSTTSANDTTMLPHKRTRAGRMALAVLLGLVVLGSGFGIFLGTRPSTTTSITTRNQPIGTITEFPLPTADSFPSGITAGPDGNFWFTELRGNKIGRITPQGTPTEFSLPTADSNPQGITVGPDGNLWFTEYLGNKIGRITPQGTLTELPLPIAKSEPYEITAGPDGNLWFAENAGIGRITPQGSLTEFALPTAHSGGHGITAGPDRNLWFTEDNRIGRITPQGSLTEFSIPTSASRPRELAVGSDGNLWFTEFVDRTEIGFVDKIGRITPQGAITEFALPIANSFPDGITAGPDGNLWFTEYNGSKIGRITPQGALTELSVPTPGSSPSQITAAPDGNLWFTDDSGNLIGRITPKGTVTEFAAYPAYEITAGPDWAHHDRAVTDRGALPGSVLAPAMPFLAIGSDAILCRLARLAKLCGEMAITAGKLQLVPCVPFSSLPLERVEPIFLTSRAP